MDPIELRRGPAIAVLILALAFMGWYVRAVIKEARAAAWAESTSLEGLRKAAELQPNNTDVQVTLARVEAMAEQDPEAAIRRLRSAAHADPYNAGIQIELASAYNLAGDSANELEAVSRAVKLDPTSPQIAWRAANFYIADGQTERGLDSLKTAATYDGSLQTPAFNIAWRATNGDINELLERAAPDTQQARLNLLIYLSGTEDLRAMGIVWDAIVAAREPFDLQQGMRYVQFLINHGKVEQAQRAWQALPTISGLNQGYIAGASNLLSNPGFELPMLDDGGFTWQYSQERGRTISIDRLGTHMGARCVRLDFAPKSPATVVLEQYVAVSPDAEYEFEAYIRTQGLEGASLPLFEVVEPVHGSVLLTTQPFPDAPEWSRLQYRFSTGPSTKLVVLRLARANPTSLISGTAWIDDLAIRHVN